MRVTHLCSLIAVFCALFLPCVMGEESSDSTKKDVFSRPSLNNPVLAKELADKIRNADKLQDVTEAFALLRTVSMRVKIDGEECQIIGYSDPVIHEAMLDLWPKLCKLYGDNVEWFGEGDDPILSYFKVYAESTLSPRLYDDEIGNGEATALHLTYLSLVNTTQTLQTILNARYEIRGAGALCLIDSSKHGKGKVLGVDAVDSMKLLGKFCKTEPELLKKNHDEILKFMERTFAETEKQPNLYRFDYNARLYALDVLDFYSNPLDASFVQKTADGLPMNKMQIKVPDHTYPASTIKNKTETLLNKLREKQKALSTNPPQVDAGQAQAAQP